MGENMPSRMTKIFKLALAPMALLVATQLAPASESRRPRTQGLRMAEITLTLPDALKRAFAAFERGQLAEAARLADAILAFHADHFDALHLRAVVMAGQRRFDEALASYDRALAVRPASAEALYNRAGTLKELKRFDEALASYDEALAARPDYVEALYNRGNTLQELNRFDEALASYDRALALRTDYAQALNNRGNTLKALRRLDEALASYDAAVAASPNYAHALSNRAVVLEASRRFDEALASYNDALAVRPDDPDAHWNKSMLQLLLGDFESGWREFEWRWKCNRPELIKRDFARPVWLGQIDIAGKTILLHAEQGLGDAIQFCRYVPLVAARGARVWLNVPESLQGLMAGFAGAEVVSASTAPQFDLHCPLLSLPLAFRTRMDSIPANVPYLNVSPQHAKSFDARLGPKDRLRVGLAWSGNPRHGHDADRSIKLQSLLPLLDTEASFISLQKDVRPDDAAVLGDRADLLRFDDTLNTFSDTAALISNLDLVISVDTSVAHLAGALAKPVWVLLQHVPDWRWLLDRRDSPWYPTARLLRQQARGDWPGVINTVAAELQELVQLHKVYCAMG
jgi:tetratricopeptide (TPR) repeat protein